ncbi:hypothetical protein EG328_000894 [Venturia inaequalis]|uniref:Uncharacterized protein n=1 Tax=Venturia inaequalis TaxID=5025 RepID=A0A8H3YLL0_VENIN|nr:hypothetical protein EG328_000894 [Venturia inaequalis]
MIPNILFLPFALLASQLIVAPLSSPTIDQGAIDKRTLSSLIDDTIKDVINNVVNSTNSLEIAVLGWSGKVEDTAPILAGSNSLLKAIQTGIAKVSNADDLSLVGLLGILTPTISLNKAVVGVADALIEKKTQADAAGLIAVVLGQLQD